jgi:6-phosphofructokinase 1
VDLAMKGENAVMPIIERVSQKPYRWRIGSARLADVANKEKKLPRNFITPDGFGITPVCRRYLEPLIQGEAYPPYAGGLPRYVQLRNKAVRKRLKTPFSI